MGWLSAEQALVRRNRVRVATKWRRHLREMKRVELEEEQSVMAMQNERAVDHQVFKLKMVNNDVDSVNRGLTVLERSHFRRMGLLSDIARERLLELQSEFVRDLAILRKEFEGEKAGILQSFEEMRSGAARVMETVSRTVASAEHESKSREETLCEELRNKNLEELNVVKISLESEIEEYEKQFDETHDRYIESTEDKNRQFAELKVKDTALSLDIESIMKRISQSVQQLAFWRKRMAQNHAECRSKNDELRQNKGHRQTQYRSLKTKMASFRQSQYDRLQNTVGAAREAHQNNQQLLETGKRILSLHAMASAKLTDKERLRPFPADLEKDPQSPLAHFVQKYNAVLLDTECLKQRRKALVDDNKKLRALLKAYLDGVTVSNHTVDEPNTLLVLNHKLSVQPRPIQTRCVVEGNQVINAYHRQMH